MSLYLIRPAFFVVVSTAFAFGVGSTWFQDQEPSQAAKTQDPAEAQAELAKQLMKYRQDVPDFPAGAEWLNTKRKLSLESLRGKFVLIDFWTYCCINCIHILPELKKLEQAFDRQLVVVGVHSAKFTTEQDARNIAESIMRYEIAHPVVVDSEMEIWNSFGCSGWPTIVLLDPEGKAVWGTRGETKFDDVAAVLEALIPIYRDKKLLDETPVHFELESRALQATPLKFPGKVLADPESNRVFVADSNHNRIVVATLDGQLLDVIGSGAIGRRDGSYDEASFDHPQGMALGDNRLYVADTENHLVRRIDLDSKKVVTIAGTGGQARIAYPEDVNQPPGQYSLSAPALSCSLNSPWALWLRADKLYIANAGSHQIWRMDFSTGQIELYAGNGREDIVDGPLRPESAPYEMGYASFAQPSGLTSDGQKLFVADSEGSSIRTVPFDPNQEVGTLVGTNALPRGRLFEFGDRDGPRDEVLLQHPLGVAYGAGRLFVADTYNSKIKAIDPNSGAAQTLPLKFSQTNDPGLNEPSGLAVAGERLFVADTNNHRIVAVDWEKGAATEWKVAGLEPPALKLPVPSFDAAVQRMLEPIQVTPQRGQLQFDVDLSLPAGWKLNPDAPLRYFWDVVEGDAIAAEALPKALIPVEPISAQFSLQIPIVQTKPTTVRIAVAYYICQESGEGLCKAGQVRWTLPLQFDPAAENHAVPLTHQIDAGSGE